jgi:hypothetical protein
MLAVLACSAPAGAPPGGRGEDSDANRVISATIAEDVSTVVRVTWTTVEATAGYVEFGETDAYGMQTPMTAAATEHEVLLLGLPSETEAHFRVVDEAGTSADQVVTTGVLPVSLPTLTASGTAPTWEGFLAVPINGITHAVLILDNQGRIVWYYTLETEANILSAFAAADRETVVFCQPGGTIEGVDGSVVRVAMDGSTYDILPFDSLAHHCAGLPDGTVVAPVADWRDYSTYSAEQLMEVSPEGELRSVWSAWDWLESMEEDPAAWVEANRKENSWSHIVSTDYYPETDRFLVSMKDLGTQVLIERSTGEVVWALNGVLNQYTYTDGSEGTTDVVHQMDLVGDELLLFDNGGQDREGSKVERYVLSPETLEVALDWEYDPQPSRGNYALGDVRRLDDETTQVVWSVLGLIEDVDDDGNVLWELGTDLGYAFSFAVHHDSLYAE